MTVTSHTLSANSVNHQISERPKCAHTQQGLVQIPSVIMLMTNRSYEQLLSFSKHKCANLLRLVVVDFVTNADSHMGNTNCALGKALSPLSLLSNLVFRNYPELRPEDN